MDPGTDLAPRTRVRRDVTILKAAIVGYLVAVTFGGTLVGLRWWAVVLLAFAVVPFAIVVAQALASRTLREIAGHPPRIELIRGASPSEFEDAFSTEELAGFADFCWLRTSCDGRRDIVGPTRHARTVDATVVLSIGEVGNVSAISRFADGRWFVTQWVDLFVMPGVIVQAAAGAAGPELLDRHRHALEEATRRGCRTVALDVVEAAQGLQDCETAAIRAMTGPDRRRAAVAMAGVQTAPDFDPTVF